MFGSIMTRKDSIEFKIIERQLAVKSLTSNSWAIYIKKLLLRYELPSPCTLLYSHLKYNSWKRLVKETIGAHWYQNIREEAALKSSLQYINIYNCQPGFHHNVWNSYNSDPLAVYRASVRAKLLVQRYPLHTNKTSGAKTTTCPCCNTTSEDLHHYLIICPILDQARAPHLSNIIDTLLYYNLEASSINIVQAILDPSKLSNIPKFIESITYASRSLCYKLHQKRSTIIMKNKPSAIKSTTRKLKSNIITS